MKTIRISPTCVQSECGRVFIYKQVRWVDIRANTDRRLTKRREVVYSIYVDGKPLDHEEFTLTDALEMATKKLKETK